MNRIYCVECFSWMEKTKTGFTVHMNKGVRIRGDLYECPTCKHKVYGDFGEPFEGQSFEERYGK